ncbi:MAG: Aspartate carbamoyltransferase [Cyanobacteriota bacterium erpe_2018_sw_39hr_WHONDRS-SW48-000098_B_bin.30]|jgi:aspartate carbamoyltransferase catalytic subunit|nr:aspartate carbamoyltransferase catalytic subunit [Candidatus Obscuribacter sp.]MDQ5964643.1 Aspartate carbamoyltransferase [Cyanobacteriota bacterium erpe_2018_sw_39hr_WHONDRS-SW48-000098_B_bin.30]
MTKTLSKEVAGDLISAFLAKEAGAKAWHARQHLLDTRDLTLGEVSSHLALTGHFKQVQAHRMPPLAILSRRTVATLFHENSTRTKSSFDLASRKVGATVLNLDIKTSSAAKGESLLDTATNLYSMGVDAIIMRHSEGGTQAKLALESNAAIKLQHGADARLSIINAGDGASAHPSQGLLDLYTMLETLDCLPKLQSDGTVANSLQSDTLKGKKIAIIGDILHSRVARSNLWLLKNLGAQVHFAGPETLVPMDFAMPDYGATVHHQLDSAIADADFIISLRIQMERQEQGLISIDEYCARYRLDHQTIKGAKPGVRILHPGPINRGTEITEALADDPKYSLILKQVTNGVLTRMSIVSLLLA